MSKNSDKSTTRRDGGAKEVAGRPVKRVRALKDSTAVSPEVDGSFATFRLLAPNARAVEIALNYPFTERRPLTRDDAGAWSIRLGPLEPRLYTYFFYLDGVAIADPANPATGRRINLGYSLVDIRGETPRDDEHQPVPHGVVHRHYYHSNVLNAERRLFVYTPPGYDTADAATPLPVIYLRHGAEQVEDSWLVAGRADTIVDNLLAEGRCRPLMFVTSNGYVTPQTGGQLRTDRNFPGAMATLGRELVEDIVPFVEARYRARADRSGRAIAGLSMGAGQSFVIGLENLDTFAHIGAFSSGVISAEQFVLDKRLPDVVAQPERINERLQLLWLGCGSDDRRTIGYARLRARLAELGIHYEYTEAPGSHEWRAWRALFARFLQQVFR